MKTNVNYISIKCDCCGNEQKFSRPEEADKSDYMKISIPYTEYGRKKYSKVAVDICQKCAEKLYRHIETAYHLDYPEYGYPKLKEKNK